MTGLPGAFLTTATIEVIPDPLTKTVATVRRFCNRRGECHNKTRRYLAEQAGLTLGTFSRALHRAQALGILRLPPRQHPRERGTLIFNAPHLFTTPEKPAATVLCSTRRNTKGKATKEEKEPPVTPRKRGEGAPLFVDEGEVAGIEAGTSAETAEPAQPRRLDPGEQCRHCGHRSTRLAPYGQPRQPRRPRPSRQHERKQSLASTIWELANRDRPTAAEPVHPALPPPPDIIPPGHALVAGEVIPMPREPLQRPRGFSPVSDLWEAFKHVSGLSDAPDRSAGDDFARALLDAGRARRDAANDRRRMAEQPHPIR